MDSEMEDLEQKEEEFYKIQKILCERAASRTRSISINTKGLSKEDVYAKLLYLQNDIKENRLILSTEVLQDDITNELSNAFDFEFNGVTHFTVPHLELPDQFNILLIVGPSGSGKSSILKSIGDQFKLSWDDNKAICSHFKSAEDAKQKLGAVGLNSIPVWMKPYKSLSTGEKFRADIARQVKDNALIDEFTSVVDRSVAKSCSFSLQRHIRKEGIERVVLASCHYDIIDWLMPDYIFDTATGLLTKQEHLRRPEIKLQLLPCGWQAWSIFSKHHYLSGDINKSGQYWIVTWDNVLIGFTAVLNYPSGTVKNAMRGHRTVVLPEFQGLGFGVRISDAVGEMMLSQGKRYFSKTASSRMGEYRNKSKLWKPTSKNMKTRKDYKIERKTKESNYKHLHADRFCYSHEYIGDSNK